MYINQKVWVPMFIVCRTQMVTAIVVDAVLQLNRVRVRTNVQSANGEFFVAEYHVNKICTKEEDLPVFEVMYS